MKNVKAGHSKPIVCLDAGHYGKYNQSPGVPAYYESEMNWKLHQLLKGQLESYGIEVRQTRADQAKDLTVYKRGTASEGCDLLLSVHSNAVVRGMDEEIDYPVVYVPLNGSGTDLGEKLAECIEKTMGTSQDGRTSSRKGKNGDYHGIIRGATDVGTVGMIVEHSFHTCTKMANWLLNDANLAKMAAAEAAVVAEYFGMSKAAPAAPAAPAAKPEAKKFYRVRKSWADAASQLGAYESLDNAKKACKEGYTVYDWNGAAVYTVAAKPAAAPAPKPAAPKPAATPSGVDPAKSFNKSMAGTYKVKANSGLNLRTGASTNKARIDVLNYGEKVQCYGYYTNGWLLVVSASGKTGYCSKSYLVKQ